MKRVKSANPMPAYLVTDTYRYTHAKNAKYSVPIISIGPNLGGGVLFCWFSFTPLVCELYEEVEYKYKAATKHVMLMKM